MKEKNDSSIWDDIEVLILTRFDLLASNFGKLYI